MGIHRRPLLPGRKLLKTFLTGGPTSWLTQPYQPDPLRAHSLGRAAGKMINPEEGLDDISQISAGGSSCIR